MSVTSATRDRPRIVTRETIAAFERNNPALKGIGAIMVDLGVWVVDSENKESRKAPAKACLSDIKHGTAQNVYYSIGSAV